MSAHRGSEDESLDPEEVAPLIEGLDDDSAEVRVAMFEAVTRLPLSLQDWARVREFVWRVVSGDSHPPEFLAVVDASPWIPLEGLRQRVAYLAEKGSGAVRDHATQAMEALQRDEFPLDPADEGTPMRPGWAHGQPPGFTTYSSLERAAALAKLKGLDLLTTIKEVAWWDEAASRELVDSGRLPRDVAPAGVAHLFKLALLERSPWQLGNQAVGWVHAVQGEFRPDLEGVFDSYEKRARELFAKYREQERAREGSIGVFSFVQINDEGGPRSLCYQMGWTVSRGGLPGLVPGLADHVRSSDREERMAAAYLIGDAADYVLWSRPAIFGGGAAPRRQPVSEFVDDALEEGLATANGGGHPTKAMRPEPTATAAEPTAAAEPPPEPMVAPEPPSEPTAAEPPPEDVLPSAPEAVGVPDYAVGAEPEPAPPVISAGALQPRPKPERYVNIVAVDRDRKDVIDRLALGARFWLRIDLGKLGETQVAHPQAFPEPAPNEDVWLDVMVSSSDFGVGNKFDSLISSAGVHARLLLPADRSKPAVTESGEQYLFIALQAPTEPRQARARVGFYYRDALLQSFLLTARLSKDGPQPFTIDVDYTITRQFEGLDRISDRPRVSVLVNDNGPGGHQLTYRARGKEEKLGSASFEVPHEDGKLATQLRKALSDRAPIRGSRSRAELIVDLQTIAPLGWKMYSAFKPGLEDLLYQLKSRPDEVVVSISRPFTSTFTLPWSAVYDIPLDSELVDAPQKIPRCPLIETWDGKAPLFEGSPRQCPHKADVSHSSNLLCPFGFWGFRYSIEQVSTQDQPVTAIPFSDAPALAAILTQDAIDPVKLDAHITDLQSLFETGLHYSPVTVAKDKATARQALGRGLSLAYFYCHGEYAKVGDPNTYLQIGHGETITPADFGGWIDQWIDVLSGTRPWEKTRPLVFINACHSLEINPDTVSSYVEAFVASGHAAGVIGTEVRVQHELAMELAKEFFARLLELNAQDAALATVDAALRAARMSFLSRGSIFGLAYTPFCWADLRYSDKAA
jgi:hypothetical protein